jgi:hypothetical protein
MSFILPDRITRTIDLSHDTKLQLSQMLPIRISNAMAKTKSNLRHNYKSCLTNNNKVVKKPLHKNCTSTCFVYFLELFIQTFCALKFCLTKLKSRLFFLVLTLAVFSPSAKIITVIASLIF